MPAIADRLIRRLEGTSRKMAGGPDTDDARRILAAFFTSPHLKTDAGLAFDESCEAVGIVGMSTEAISLRMRCETIILDTVRSVGADIDVSSLDPLSSRLCKERE